MARSHDLRLANQHPVTPDGRYFLVRGRLWRMSDPSLDPVERQALVDGLMSARRAVGVALRSQDAEAEGLARTHVDTLKRALGERGSVWWDDGAPDLNRHMAKTTVYSAWAARVQAEIVKRSDL